MARTRTAAPTRKVAASGIAGALSVVLIWAARQFAHTEVPPEVASAITIILAFLVGYITPPADGEVIDDVPAVPVHP